MSLDKLRKLYKTAKKNGNTGLMQKIEKAGKAAKSNPNFGSDKVGGNGFCYSCLLNKARPNRYNCTKCSGIKYIKKNKWKDLTVYQLQKKILSMRKYAKKEEIEQDDPVTDEEIKQLFY